MLELLNSVCVCVCVEFTVVEVNDCISSYYYLNYRFY